MEKQKTQLVILGLLALLLVIAVFVISQQQPSTQTGISARRSSARAGRTPTLEQLKEDEFLEIGHVSPEPQPRTHRPSDQLPDTRIVSARPGSQAPVQTLRVPSHKNALAKGGKAGSRAGSSGFGSSGASTGRPAGISQLAGRSSAGMARPGMRQDAPSPNAVLSRSKQEPDATKKPFLPYANAMTRKEAESLEKKLAGLSRGIEKAVLEAMLPKNKKAANIEKYLNRRYGDPQEASSSAGADNGPFAGVARQISRQKNSIVSSMKNTYGQKAANRAGKVMDSYQKELMSELNQPGQTAEQIQQKTRQISKKYNEQLQEISQQSALDQLRQEREARDLAMQQELEKKYGSEIAAAVGRVQADYREKELAIAQQTDLTEDEKMQLLWENDRSRDRDIKKEITNRGQPLSGYQEVVQAEQKRIVGDRLRKEEEGEVAALPKFHTKEEQNREREQAQTTVNDFFTEVEKNYGPEALEEMKHVTDEYEKDLALLAEQGGKEGLSIGQYEDKKLSMLQEANQKLLDIQKKYALIKLHQDPAWEQASDEQRVAWEQQLRESFERQQKSGN